MESTKISLREAFGKTLVELGKRYDFYVVDCDVAGGTGTYHFREAFPERFIQAGIAEQNATGLAAGLASIGKPVFLCLFSQFALRAYEIAMLSIAYSNRNVKVILSHCGVESGPDGASNQSLNHYAVWRSIPNMVVVHPADAIELEKATEALLKYNRPAVMFTGRNPQSNGITTSQDFEIGKCNFPPDQIFNCIPHMAIIASGIMVERSIMAGELLKEKNIYARIINMSTIKPIDKNIIKLYSHASEFYGFVTCEDHSIIGGLGSAVAEVLARCCPCPIEMVGIRDEFGQSGTPEELAEHYHLTSGDIVKAALRVIERKKSGYDELCRRAFKYADR